MDKEEPWEGSEVNKRWVSVTFPCAASSVNVWYVLESKSNEQNWAVFIFPCCAYTPPLSKGLDKAAWCLK